MREIFDQERAMTLGAVKQATGVLAILFLIAAAFAVLSGLGQIFSGHVFHGIGRIVASLTVLGFLYIVVRLLAEILAALHRLNDRLSVVGDDIRTRRSRPVADPTTDTRA
ncbi:MULTISPECIES: hypothetical protein [unclassified Hyphomonas]|jgi:hypothetical protein|uniref:hypothetical protein n=1 Tax=unclassified Hyphomonas TaxID=2630699 RepID=UPI000C517FB8|nr:MULTISPECIES: hypothetical protein [unclassified Hyphomonas]MAL43892.1 hypothetical protein [Hyphomonas sp.]MAX84282.1 hypothetical protein [Hyphomonas sp.]HAO35568.1 hypothetical protein [Hyphomonas sp.]HAW57020.1 hypothetical protein [Hyphomonas sp.]HBJ42362.1 hypothetical protein [Hyphomonas sp.]|tara:strand:- start:138 stop:467 length:330 start_codon:yes stop_codon:yes gene_type:complete